MPGEFFTVLWAGGLVGAQLVRYLRARGATCTTPARHDWNCLAEPMGHVIYLIGLAADHARRPLDTVEAHVSLFNHLLRDGDFQSVVYLSSTRLYDSGGADGRESGDLILNPLNPRHIYDLSKALGESLCASGGRDNVRAARLSCVYADDLSAENFLHQLVRRALREGEITVKTNPEFARDYVHVDDVCAALVDIARFGRRPIYNVAIGVNVDSRCLLALIERSSWYRKRGHCPG